MRALKIAFALLCVLLAASVAFGLDVVRYENVVRNTRGDVIGGASISVYTANTTTAVTLYSTVAGTTTKANPTATDTAGRFFFYVVPGTYDVRVSGSGITTYTLEDVDLTGGAFAREATDPQLLYGDGAPTGDYPIGSLYQRGDGVQDSTLYIQGPTDWYSVMMPVNRTGSEYAEFGDQTPDVSGTDFLIFSNHAPTSVTFFDGGVDGQILSVFVSDSFTALVAGGLSGGLFMEDDLYGNGTYAVFLYSSNSNAWFLMWSSNMANVAQDYYLDNWDPYGIDATLPVLSDPNFWPGWDATAPRPLYNLVSGTCSASLDSTVVLTLGIVADEAVVVSTMLIAGTDTTITNYAGSYVTNPQRIIQTGLACADGDVYRVNYKIANAAGAESPWWYGGSFTVVINEQEFPVLAHLAGSVSLVGYCGESETAELEMWFNTDIPCTANMIWTKVGSGDTSSVVTSVLSTSHDFGVQTDSTCTNGSQFSTFFSLTNEDDETGERYGPYTYTVSGLDETAPSQGVAALAGQCSATNSQVYLQLDVTAQEACYMSAQWRAGTTGTYALVPQQTAFSPVHTLSIDTGNACVANQVYYVQYRLTDQFSNTSAWFSGGSYTATTTPPSTDTLAPVFSATGSSVAASVVNGNAVLTVTINADETFSAFCHARSGTHDIAFGVPAEDPQGNPNFGDPITRVINTGVVAVNGQAWTVTATLFDDDYNYTNIDAVTVGTAIVNMQPTFGPNITSVTGMIDDGQGIAINGNGFGSTGPTVVFFDDMELGTNGSQLDTGVGSAQVGSWNALGDARPYYTSSAAHSGSLSMQTNMSTSWVGHAEVLLPVGTQEVFGSWWMYIPDGTLIPGEGSGSGTNWKTVWLQGAGTDDNDLVLPTRLTSGWSINGNDSPFTGYVGLNFIKGQWKRVWAWLKSGYSNDGNIHFWELDDSGVILRGNWNGVSISNAGEDWERIRFNGYGRQTQNSYPTFDDMYVAVGSGARARVEIGNSPTYASCTKITIATTTTWGETQVAAIVRRGDFSADDQAYIYVFDSYGAISNPFPVTWGDAGGGDVDSTPPAISGGTFSYSNLSYGDGVFPDSLAVVVSFGTSEPCKFVTQWAATDTNGVVINPPVYAPADTSGEWSLSISTAVLDTVFTGLSHADTIGYITRFLLEDASGNMSEWVSAGSGAFGEHIGVPDTTIADPVDTVYYTFGWNLAGDHPVIDGTPYEFSSGSTVVQDSLYYFLWATRSASGGSSATTQTAASRFGSFYEFGGYSDPLSGGLQSSAPYDTSCVSFSGIGAARRLSGMGQYITEAKYYFRQTNTDPLADHVFGPSPNFYAAAICTNSVIFEAEPVALGNAPPNNYLTNNISYNTVGEGTWDAARTTFDSVAKYGIGVSTQQTFIWQGAPFAIETWYYHDFTAALQSWYAGTNNHGVIIAQMGHAPGVTGPAYPDIGAWHCSTANVRPVLLVKLEIPRSLRVPIGQTIPAPPSGNKGPNIIQEP